MSVLNDFVTDSKTWAKLWIELKLHGEKKKQHYSNGIPAVVLDLIARGGN